MRLQKRNNLRKEAHLQVINMTWEEEIRKENKSYDRFVVNKPELEKLHSAIRAFLKQDGDRWANVENSGDRLRKELLSVLKIIEARLN
jgi:hypothetical protein